MEKFAFLAHTADVRMRVRGRTLAELFENAAAGMFAWRGGGGASGGAVAREVAAAGADDESLLVNWLNELLYASEKAKASFSTFSILALGNRRLHAVARGRRAARGRPYAEREIKAATYQGLRIKKGKSGFQADIIFDV